MSFTLVFYCSEMNLNVKVRCSQVIISQCGGAVWPWAAPIPRPCVFLCCCKLADSTHLTSDVRIMWRCCLTVLHGN